MTKIQEISQCDGPWCPTIGQLSDILSTLPKRVEIRAISVNGQSGKIVVESCYEGFDMTYVFNHPYCA